MTKQEAAKLVALIAAHYPEVRLEESNLNAYEHELVRFPGLLAYQAAEDWWRREPRFPHVSELIDEMVRIHAKLVEPEEAWCEVMANRETKGPTPWSHPEVKEALLMAGGWWAVNEHLPSARKGFLTAYAAISRARRTELVARELPAAAAEEKRIRGGVNAKVGELAPAAVGATHGSGERKGLPARGPWNVPTLED